MSTEATSLQTTTPPAPPPTAPVVRAQRPERLVTHSAIALMDTAMFDHMQRIAALMCKMELLPIHLRARPWFYPKKKTDNLSPAEENGWREKLGPEGFAKAWADADARTVANCILVVDQALRWEMNPFSTMGSTFEVGGKLGNEGKLIAAVVNSRAGLKSRLRYEFSGEGDLRTVTVLGTFEGEEQERTVDLVLRDAKTTNQMWTKDPDQKLIYSAVLKWARRHCPEVIMGVMTEDDSERVEIIPEPTRFVPLVPSALDAFAAGGPAALPAANPGPVIDLTPPTIARVAPRGETAAQEAPGTVATTPESDPGAPTAGEPSRPTAEAERPAPQGHRLSPERLAKVRALLAQPPAVGEAVLADALRDGATTLSEVEAEPGEGATAFHTRVLGEVDRLKPKK